MTEEMEKNSNKMISDMNIFSCSLGCTCANTRHETYQYKRQNYSQSQHAYMSSSKQHHSSSSVKVTIPLFFFTVIQLLAFDKPEQSLKTACLVLSAKILGAVPLALFKKSDN